MTITSMTFLFCFLPITLAVYYIVNDEIKEYVLLAVSLILYSIGSLQYFTLFIIVIFITVALGRGINGSERPGLRKFLLVTGIMVNVSVLGYYKYIDFAILNFNRVSGKNTEFKNLLLPLGISFFTFKAISYLTDVYNREVKIDTNLNGVIHDALYLSFFAQVQSGPLTRYKDSFCANTKEKRIPLFSDGVFRFLVGFNKKVLLADVLGNITTEIFSNGFENFSTAYAWLGSICYSLQLFYDFAGYSDMAIGISEMFGYHCMENFNYPYMTESVTKFWRRWHISLSQWFRDYIYIPMGGSRTKKKYRIYFNLFVVWLLTGIWHGASWHFVAWGLGYFVLIAFERAAGFPDRLKTKAGKIVYRIVSLIIINCQWVMFRATGIAAGVRFLKTMFIPTDDSLANLRTIFLIKDYFVFILFGFILCFPIVHWMNEKMKKAGRTKDLYEIITGIIVIVLFIWAISFVVSGQNNPFAYANF